MDQASTQCMDDDAPRFASQQNERLPKVVVHFPVAPGTTLTWRVEAHSTLAVNGARLWLTRVCSPYDYWLVPGQTINLQRGERIWLSTDGERTAHVSLTYLLPAPGFFRRCSSRLASLSLGPPAPR